MPHSEDASQEGDRLERAFQIPADILDEGVALWNDGKKSLVTKTPLKSAQEYWHTIGPGLTTGAADDDPSGIGTYSQAGAQFGLGLIWTAVFTFPFMATVQEMCARIGIVTGEGLAANIRKRYVPGVLYAVTALLFFANTLNIEADLSAMAASARLLIPEAGALLLVLAFALLSLLLQVFTTYARYARYLKYLTLVLLSYVVVAFVAGLDWTNVIAHALVPQMTFSSDQLLLVCAILGTTISPYLFFWQTSQEVEEDILKGERTVDARRSEATPRALKKMRTDVWSGMLLSNLVTFFIFAACAGTLYVHGITNIVTAAQAAEALRPFGEFTFLLFALGIIGTGLLAIPVLAGSTAYALAESFGWKYGLYRKLKQARAFYGVIIVSMILGVLANVAHLDPIKGLIYAAVANGVIAPIILFFVVRLSGSREVMGSHKNGWLAATVGWVTIVGMGLSGIAAIVVLL